jgi:hypothetical protein
MNQRPIDAEPVDPHVRLDTREIGDFSYITAEIGSLRQSGVTRDHTRLIGKGKRGVTGHPLVYSDSYSGSREDVYVYARHRLTQKEFFSRLDLFLETTLADFPELTGKPLLFSFQVNGEFVESELFQPLIDNLEIPPEQIDFARLSINIGDIAVEFNSTPVVLSDETAFTQKGVLRRKLESPLFGFDASRSDLWAPFLAEIHWASGLISREILQTLIRSAATVKA